ncbi:Membrane protein insertase YidC [Hyella patelloides LEGE 07179]|uniref:Membrane protein insertase YidC n=1 Tax=Hyella patelloides LEGE 07179 TaxID=945734 RepID=A0A563VL50_9CYAN|nr:membrane protein insertase YidC [Hyella patelloides]VEP12035.1 Membrane protein insertase YidC [Hyella patelloides LEGE 07179]
MDFGIGFISNNIMLPILDFFYGIVPSYGLAIIALTLVIRFAVFPLSAGQIRNMRKMRIVQPLMKERQEAIKQRYQNEPKKQQEEMAKLMQEFGNPLAGCLPLLLQMPILFALFATLRGSPFTDTPYTVDLQIFPREQIERIQPQPFATKAQNIYLDDGFHDKIEALLPGGNKLAVGETTRIELQTPEGKPFDNLLKEYSEKDLVPQWEVTKGSERLNIKEDGTIEALEPGDATVQVAIHGIAADKGFLFIKALGQVGVTDEDGNINFDILFLVLLFGISIYVNQQMSGSGNSKSDDPGAQQQQAISKITPVLFSGMFLFFPLPAGVLMYIVVASLFQMGQTWFLMQEELPENLQKIIAEQEKADKNRESLPFERKRSKKKEKTSG